MQIVIIAGGKGTRLQDRLGDLPKPMVDVCGRPLLEHQVLLARRHGFEDVLLLLGYGAEAIRSHFGNGSRWGLRIRYEVETSPLGTAGCVLAALPALEERFVVMYGDTMLNVDLRRFWDAHTNSHAAATLFLHPNGHPRDSDLVEVDSDGRVMAFHPYPRPTGSDYANLVNAALYVVEKSALQIAAGRTDLPDFARHFFPFLLSQGAVLQGYRSPEYIHDAGTPGRLDQVIADFRSGRIAHGSLATPSPAVFLDRDGTLNAGIQYVKRAEELEMLPGVAEAIRRLNQSGHRSIVVTNQPVVARGDCSEAELRRIHNKLESVLGDQGAYLDAIYYCPHHPHRGFTGERPELKIDCSCRKPATGLIYRAAAELNLDLARSWLIGDSTTDLQTAANAGLRSILVETGHAGTDRVYDVRPDYRFPSLFRSVQFLLSLESQPTL